MNGRRSLRRVAMILLGVPLLLLIMLSLLLAWVMLSEGGTRWAVGQAKPFLPEGVRIGRVEGVLAGPLRIGELAVETPRARVTVRHLELDWAPADLVVSRVRVTDLAVRGVEVTLRAPADPVAATGAAAPSLPEDLLLPVEVVLERLRVEGVAVRLPSGALQRVDTVSLGAAAGPGGFRVEDLALVAPMGSVRGDVRLDGGRPFGLDGTLRWRLEPPEPRLRPLAGTLQLGGSLRRLQLRLRTREPTVLTARLDLEAFGGTPRWSGRLTAGPTRLDAWWSEAPPLQAAADLGLEGTFDEVGVSGSLELEGLPTGPLGARLAARLADDSIRVERLRIEARRRPGAVLEASGGVDLGTAGPRFEAQLRWQDLAWPLEAGALASSPTGEATVRGVPDDYALNVSGQLRSGPTGDEPVQFALRGQGSTRALIGLQLDADWHGTSARAGGDVHWSPEGSARVEVALRDLDPGRLRAELEGNLSADARLEVGWTDGLRGTLELESVDGRLNGRPLAGRARLRHEGGVTEIGALQVTAGTASLAVDGRIDRRLALDWRLEVPDLTGLLPGLSGRVEGQGRLEGTPEQPRIAVTLDAEAIAASGLGLESARLEGQVAPRGGARTDVRLRGTSLATEALTLDSLDVRLAGTPDEHGIEAEAQGARGEVRLALRGGLDAADWQGRIERLNLAAAGEEEWSIEDPAALAWRDGELALARTCLRDGVARVCLSGGGRPERWQLQLDAQRIPLALVADRARADLEYEGHFGLAAELQADGGPLRGHAEVELGPGRVSGVIEQEPEILLEFGPSRASLRLEPEWIDFDADLDLTRDDVVRLQGRVGRNPPRELDARLRARIGNLGLVPVITPIVGRVEGVLEADLSAGGTVAAPSLAGTLALDSGRLEVVPLGIELTELDADLRSDEGALEVRGSARSGEGRLVLAARLEQAGAEWVGSGRIEGEDFEAVDLPQATVVVTPAIDWRLQGRDLDLQGDVRVPRARIAPRDLSNTVQTSADTVIVGAEARRAERAERPLRLRADLLVELGPDIHIDAFGLDGRLEGGIRVREVPEKVAEASGELRVAEGTYSIYQQTLEIERGRVLFDGGPLVNPGLDVRAVRRPRGVLVGAHVRGRLQAPEVTLFSEPPMTESQQLSYLVLGVPLGGTSQGQQATLGAAAAALANTEQGARLTNTVGIQEVSVDYAGANEGASLVLGRYLSPRLYVGYGIGLMEQANSVRVRYDLSDKWTLEAISGEISSADLLYSIEVDSSADALPELPSIPGLAPSSRSPHPPTQEDP